MALAQVTAAGDDPYSLIFLDWNMPGMNGVEVARRLRTGTVPSPRIVVVTSAGQNEAEAAFAGAEVCALVLKPVSATSLAAAIAEMGSGPARIRETAVAAQTRRLDGLRVLLVDDVINGAKRDMQFGLKLHELMTINAREVGRDAFDRGDLVGRGRGHHRLEARPSPFQPDA